MFAKDFFFLSILYYAELWHFPFAEHWALKNTTENDHKRKNVTCVFLLFCNKVSCQWALLCNNILHIRKQPFDYGQSVRSHNQSGQSTEIRTFHNRRSVHRYHSVHSRWVAGVVVEVEKVVVVSPLSPHQAGWRTSRCWPSSWWQSSNALRWSGCQEQEEEAGVRDPVEHWGHLLVQEMQHTWLEQPGTGRLWH